MAWGYLYDSISTSSMFRVKVLRSVLDEKNLGGRVEKVCGKKYSEMKSLKTATARHIRHGPHDEYDAAAGIAQL